MPLRDPSGEVPADTLTVLGALAAAPYALAVFGVGLEAVAKETYPRAFGVEWYTDLQPEFPHGVRGVAIGTFILLIAAWMIAGLVLTVRRNRIAKWLTVGWLVLAVPIAYSVARQPDQSRRCFLDGYSDRLVCASPTTVTLRDFALLALPALVAIGCLIFTRTSRRAPTRAE